MPGVIDSLVISLGLDSSGLSSGASRALSIIDKAAKDVQRRATELEGNLARVHQDSTKRLKESGETLRVTAQGVQGFQRQLVGVFTVLASGFGLANFVNNMTKAEAQMGRTSRTIGIGVSELNTWQEAAKRAGGSAEGVTSSFLTLSQEIENIRLTGHSDLQQYFSTLGISISDATGKAKELPQIYRELNKEFNKRSPAEAAFFGNAMHIDPGMMPLLTGTPEELEKHLAGAKQSGVVSPQDVKNAQTYQEQLAKLEQSVNNLKRVFLNAALPDITKWLGEITKWIDDPKNQKFIADTVVEGIKKLGHEITSVVEAIDKWKGAAEALAAFMAVRFLAQMMLGLGPVGIAVAGIVAGMVALKEMARPSDPHDDPESSFWLGMSEEDQLKDPKSPASRRKRGETGTNTNTFSTRNPFTWLDTPVGGLADTSMSDAQRGFLNTLAGPESGGDYHIMNGNQEQVEDLSHHPNRIGKGGTSTAFGKYQFTYGTWNDYQKKLNLPDIGPVSQDRAAWAYASDLYKGKWSRDLEKDVSEGGHETQIADALRGAWPSMPGGSQSKQSMESFSDALRRNQLNRPSLSKGASERFLDPGDGKPPAWQGWLNDLDKNLKAHLLDPVRGGRSAPAAGDKVSSNEVHINGDINIHTQAEDANGIAKDIGGAIRRNSFITPANSGLA